jgi:hypothetical protein
MQSPNAAVVIIGTTMSTRRRVGLELGLTVVFVAAFAAYLLPHAWQRRRAAAIESAIQNEPLMISVIERGGIVPGRDRVLHLDPSGNVTVRTDSTVSGWDLPLPIVNVTLRLDSAQKTRRFVVPKTQLDELRSALVRDHFFDLNDSYGELIPGGSATTIQVTAGEFSKTVELHYLGNWTGPPEGLGEPNRALHVLQLVRSWFDDDGKIEAGKR